jgi:hypothetical protein
MELNRNHYFMIGIVLLLLGLQVRLVDSYLLTEEATEIVSKHMKKAKQVQQEQPNPPSLFMQAPPTPAVIAPKQQKVSVPQWVGWACISAGGVLVLHSLAMKRPE